MNPQQPKREITSIDQTILGFFSDYLEVSDSDLDPLLQSDSDLFQTGILDSASLVSLIVYLEATFNISISEEFLIQDTFSSIKSIRNCVLALKE